MKMGIDNIVMFPNPAGNYVTLSGISGLADISVCNLAGQPVIQKTCSLPEITIDLSGIAKGCYLINIQTEKSKIVKKLLVE